jgi:GH15 family glucan-1,4-alpha-glucosidase
MIPLAGFLPATDDRVRSTVEAIERDLIEVGLVLRYRAGAAEHVDGLEGREGAFLACSFWSQTASTSWTATRTRVGYQKRLLELRKDLGLLAEEYDSATLRQLGDFPQAFHLWRSCMRH